jgi:hypothetical protein
MVIIEFPTFTRAITALLSDKEYAELRRALIRRPDMGHLIPNGKGLRKVCWTSPREDKRNEMQIIYYWVTADEQVLMLFAHTKNQQSGLTEEEKQTLVKLIEEELKDG